jgi:hypothetical protein
LRVCKGGWQGGLGYLDLGNELALLEDLVFRAVKV